MPTSLVTGGAGFIGSALVRQLLDDGASTVANVDALTYAGNLEALGGVKQGHRHHFHHVDIRDAAALRAVFDRERPERVFHLAAESHVDRSIDGPEPFVSTNVVGTMNVLQESLRHWRSLSGPARHAFRVVHVSTDEVYGSAHDDERFTEQSCYAPSSPYAASKAAADHLARAWHHTYGLPVVLTNCTNNFGPYQFPEKLIPLMIAKALAGDALPVYGSGEQVRDWLYVDDHAQALRLVAERGTVGETYHVGANATRRNIDVVRALCALLDELRPSPRGSYEKQINSVPDRPGHDQRYALEASKLRRELGWAPTMNFEDGLRRTVEWYLAHPEWYAWGSEAAYRGERLGVVPAVPVSPVFP
ncbi:MAG: dTDP-glucose 4,6-dehydratase [Gemmatimonadaceae bacterium]|nr:dTDP-glucose 4,6-dehydratase [Gemmatimonadaceae bacterium]